MSDLPSDSRGSVSADSGMPPLSQGSACADSSHPESIPSPSRGSFPRPLSPHLHIYRPELTSVLSIMHRLTGAALCLALPLWAAFLWSLSTGYSNFECMTHFCSALWVQPLFLCVILGYVYHALNGVRHLMWDRGCGLELKQVYTSGWIVLGLTMCLTAILGVLLLKGASI